MSVRRCKSKNGQVIEDKWVIDYYPAGRKGKRIQQVFHGSEADARQAEQELRRQNRSCNNAVNPAIKDIIPHYFKWAELHLAPKTVKDRRKSVKHILAIFGHLPISYITPSHIQKYKELRKPRSRSTNIELVFLQAIIKYACKQGWASPLPFRIEKVPHKYALPKIPHPRDIEAMLKAIKGPKKRALMTLIWLTGLRWSDASHIKWENIDWKQGIIRLIQKGGTERLTILPDRVKALIEPYRATQGYVFESQRRPGRPYTEIREEVQSACKIAKIPYIRPHQLRHAFGTYSLQATGDMRLVQEMLGHKHISSTQIYTKVMHHKMLEGIKRTAHYASKLVSDTEGKDDNKGSD